MGGRRIREEGGAGPDLKQHRGVVELILRLEVLLEVGQRRSSGGFVSPDRGQHLREKACTSHKPPHAPFRRELTSCSSLSPDNPANDGAFIERSHAVPAVLSFGPLTTSGNHAISWSPSRASQAPNNAARPGEERAPTLSITVFPPPPFSPFEGGAISASANKRIYEQVTTPGTAHTQTRFSWELTKNIHGGRTHPLPRGQRHVFLPSSSSASQRGIPCRCSARLWARPGCQQASIARLQASRSHRCRAGGARARRRGMKARGRGTPRRRGERGGSCGSGRSTWGCVARLGGALLTWETPAAAGRPQSWNTAIMRLRVPHGGAQGGHLGWDVMVSAILDTGRLDSMMTPHGTFSLPACEPERPTRSSMSSQPSSRTPRSQPRLHPCFAISLHGNSLPAHSHVPGVFSSADCSLPYPVRFGGIWKSSDLATFANE